MRDSHEPEVSLPPLFLATPELLFPLPTDEAERVIKVLGCGLSEATDLECEQVDAMMAEWISRGFKVACGCNEGENGYPILAPVARHKIVYLRQTNEIPHAPHCPLSLSPLSSARRPNVWREVRLREIARRLRPSCTWVR